MDYTEMLKLADTVRQAPPNRKHKLRDELWYAVLQSIAGGNWNADVWAKVALQADEPRTGDGAY